MNKTTIENFLLARPQPVGPTESFVNELKLNGKSTEFIQYFIETGRLDYDDLSVDLYNDAEGYVFDWGHVLEDIGAHIFNGEIFIFASWNIVLDSVLDDFHRRGLHLENLTVVCETLLSDQNGESHFSRKIPQCLEVEGGNEASAFELISCGTGENGVRQIQEAREWLAKCFLTETVNDLISAVRKSLQEDVHTYDRQ